MLEDAAVIGQISYVIYNVNEVLVEVLTTENQARKSQWKLRLTQRLRNKLCTNLLL